MSSPYMQMANMGTRVERHPVSEWERVKESLDSVSNRVEQFSVRERDRHVALSILKQINQDALQPRFMKL
jgi:hypothetical protein